MKVRFGTIVVTSLTLISASAVSDAALLQFRMSGTVTVHDPTKVLPAEVVTGAPFTAFLTYDTNVPDSLPSDPNRGRYEFTDSGRDFGLSLSVGNLVLRDDPADEFIIQVINDAPVLPGFSAPSDALLLQVDSLGGPDYPSSLVRPRLTVSWDNLEQDSWYSDELPLDLGRLDIRRAEVSADGADEQPPFGRPYFITASVTQVTIIPEPQTLAYVMTLTLLAVGIWHLQLRVRTRDINSIGVRLPRIELYILLMRSSSKYSGIRNA